ncbi:MAG: DsbA family protein [Pseudomonadota bacterium]
MRFLRSAGLIAALLMPLALPAQAGVFEDLSDEDRIRLHQEVRDYILSNPEIIFDAIRILEERRVDEAAQAERDVVAQHANELFADGYSHVAGNPDGDVVVVEFLDYRCGFCKRSHPEIKEMLERDPNIRLIVKEFPILGPDSVAAGRMALAAMEVDPSKYGELNDALMEFRGQLNETMAYRIARQVGYDIADLKEVAQSEIIEERLQRNYSVAQSLGLQGTPSFVIGDQIVRGYLPVDQMLARVADARQASN